MRSAVEGPLTIPLRCADNFDIAQSAYLNSSERPWWEVRAPLIGTLALLSTVLVTFVSRPQIVEQTLRLAGF